MTATRPHPLPLHSPSPARAPLASAGRTSLAAAESSDRRRLLDQALGLFEQARQCAADGDTAASAQAILQALNCERRAGGLGPQVLQLIKPR